MFPRYIFHKDSEVELIEFLKAAEELHKNNSDEDVNLIKTYLREIESQQNPTQLTSNQSPQPENNDLIISQHNTQTQNPTTTQQEFNEPDQFNFSATNADITEIIVENLIKAKTISQCDLNTLVNTCNDTQIEQLILQIKEGGLDVKGVCNFGMALCENNSEGLNVVFSRFYEYVLFPLLNSEQSIVFQEMFNSVCKKFHKVLNKESIVKDLLQENCSGIFLQNISQLDGELKNEIIRELIVNCKQLEQIHVKVLDCLLDKNIHHGVIKIIITLLASQGETRDKATGKMVVSLMQILGRNLYQFEQPLRQIIAKHKSVWKTKLQKTFDATYQCSQLSQTLTKLQ